jgi:hypothetical protein
VLLETHHTAVKVLQTMANGLVSLMEDYKYEPGGVQKLNERKPKMAER